MSRTISERLTRLKRLRGSLPKDVAALDQEIAALEAELRAAGFKPQKDATHGNAVRFSAMTVPDATAALLGRPRRSMRLSDIVARRR